MSNQIIFRRSHFIVERSYCRTGSYFTIVNTRSGTHSHAYGEELTAAIMICKNAHRGKVPKSYPDWMQESIRRILDDQ